MRIAQAAEHQQAEEDFATFLLHFGEAKIPVVPEEGEYAIKLSDTLTIPGDKLKNIVQWMYEDMLANISSPMWLCEHVILCPTNSEVDIVNLNINQSINQSIFTYTALFIQKKVPQSASQK